ncbi:MAG: rRNA maturation RNase YbeY [Dysgonamonadaceae bacterium]|jgi:rRNA maturation RNase YbeY|nr:rRNA maturation RNase YbeY [Dysgonamonadaceae bacterium]
MAIFYESISVSVPKMKRRETSRWIKQIINLYGKKPGNVSYIFCSDEEILQINRQYLHHDYYTDIITFDYTEEDAVSGDLFISLDTVKSNAEKFGTDYSDELARVMIHGVLHLCGLNDKTPEDEKTMRLKEDEALLLLKSVKGSENEI